MKNALRFRATLAVVLLLAGSVLACSLGLTKPTPPASPIPVSTEAAGQLEETWQTAIASADGGQVSVVMTEEQLTSYVALKLANDPQAPISDVQVFLRDGKMTIQGTATVKGFKAPAEIVLNVTTTEQGKLKVNIENADFGPVPVPNSMLDSLSTALNETMSGEFGPQATGVKITAVTISDGQMAVTGTVTK